MLISFRVRNFKSFSADATLNLTAHKSDKSYGSALIARPDGVDGEAQLLPAIAIYGANASGKTNYLLAIKYMRDAIVFSQAKWKPTGDTGASPNIISSELSTEMECVLLIEGVRYRYGFQVNSECFLQEWLYSYPVGRERVLFLRETSSENQDDDDISVSFGRSLSGDKRDHNSSLRRVRRNSLFISAMAQDNQEESRTVFNFFERSTSVFKDTNLQADYELTSNFAARYQFFNKLFAPLLQTADSSIKEIDLISPDGISYKDADLEKFDVNTIFTPIFNLDIKGAIVQIPFENQSRGVKRLYEIALHIIMSLVSGRLLIFDEIESSLHPHMVAKIIGMFQNPSINENGAQIIFSTHDTYLLNQQNLRRDQVWFVEKIDGISDLYSLLEYSPRKDDNLESNYLKGRYGAVPDGGLSLAFFQKDAVDEEDLRDASRGME